MTLEPIDFNKSLANFDTRKNKKGQSRLKS